MLADDILATKLGTAIDFYRMSSLYPPAEVPSSITDQFEEATRFHVPPCPAYDKFREVACGPWGQHRYRGEVNDAWEPHGHGILMDMNTGVAQFSQRAKGGKSGRFVNGLPQGDIYSEYPDGTRVNAWYDQGRVVCGTVSKADGRRYVGELAWDCVAHGKGSLFLPEHDAWAEGSFALDAREGPCKITFGDGKVVEAEFKADKIVQGLVTYKGGTWYKGELEGEGVPHGRGEIYDPEEDVVESGVFEHGRRQGIFVSDRKVSTFVVFDLFFCCVVFDTAFGTCRANATEPTEKRQVPWHLPRRRPRVWQVYLPKRRGPRGPDVARQDQRHRQAGAPAEAHCVPRLVSRRLL